MFRLKFYAAMFAVIIGLLITFNQTARAQACVTNPVVVNNLDSGAGTLRKAVIDACAGSSITFSASMPPEVSLTTGQIVIDKNLTIQGSGADRLTVRNGASSRIFQVNTGVTATISGLTIEDGTNGGISNAGTLTVADCVIRSNKGSGIRNSGNLTVVNSVLSDNESEAGGAINNTGTAAITNSTILHNSARTGGGIYNHNSMTITNSSITGNTATGELFLNGNVNTKVWGSAITNQNGRVTITNSTIAGNDDEGFASTNCFFQPNHVCRPGYGTAISMVINVQGGSGGDLNLINSTVTDNILINLFSNAPYSVTARNSIINGLWGFESFATLNSQGNNLIVNSDGHNVIGDLTGNILGVNPRLGPLGYHGGSTMTHALLTGSPAINAGNTATSPATDQRGASRVGAADIGAFELNNSANGGNFVVQLPDAFTEIAYSHLLVEGGGGSLTGGALPTGISLSTTESSRVLVSGRTAQTGVFDFSFTATDYRLRVLPSGAPPFGGCRSNVVVANKSDAGEGTLRQAVIDACAGGTISFGEAVRGKIHLTGGPIAINKNLTIAGPGADALTLRSAVGSGFRNNVVLVNPGVTAVISGLTVSDGFADVGGGISNSGNLTVRNVVLSNNRGINSGGAIVNYGTLTLDRSLVTGNGFSRNYAWDRRIFVFEGGGIYSLHSASLTITDSTVSGNNADQGGGIYATSATITNTTISDNRAVNLVFGSAGLGGGLYLDSDGMTTLTNCTVSQNYVYNDDQSEGGGIYMDIFGTLSLINTTVANNEIVSGEVIRLQGAGISMAFAGALGTVNARNSIIAGNKVISNNGTNSVARQFNGRLTSQGYNLFGSISAGQISGDTTGNIVAADPRLSPLGYYGGPTQTQALLTGSPAINAGSNALAIDKDGIPLTTDQRGAGFPRIVGSSADIGAYELGDSTPTPTPTPTVTPTPTPTVTPTPTPTPNTPPIANNDSAGVSENSTLNINAPGVLVNDTDGENDPLTATLVTNAANGSVTLNADGSFSYTPNADFNGTDSFTYKANDGSLDSNTATVTITVSEVNDSPTAVSDSKTTDEDTKLVFNASDPTANDSAGPANESAQTLTVTTVTATNNTHGTVSLNNGQITYQPAADYNGAASFDYQVCDNGTTNGAADSLCAVGMVNITINAINDAPTAVDDSADTNEDTPLNIIAPGVLGNDSDVENDSLTALLVSSATNGTLSLNADGSFSYTPNANFNGTDSFTYKANDGTADSDTATITIMVNAVNDAPTADNQTADTDEDASVNVSLTASDAENDALTYTVTASPANGTLSGTFPNLTYTPNADYNGVDSFEFKAIDGEFDSNIATVSVTVNSVNDAPTITAASGISRQQAAGSSNSQIAAVGDIDTAANSLTVTPTLLSGSGVGVSNISVDADGNVTANVSANCGATNSSFTLTVSDGNSSATATLNVSVTAESTPPVIDSSSYANITVNLPAGSTATSMNVDFTLPTASDNCGGAVTLTTDPVSGSLFRIGTTIVTITATDASGNQSTATFTVTVAYSFSGFLSPISNTGINSAKAGSAIPVKFSLSGYQGAAVITNAVSSQIPCPNGGGTTGDEIPTAAAGNSGLSYDASTDTYTYVWKTDKKWKNTCRRLAITLNDGTTQTADFQFK